MKTRHLSLVTSTPSDTTIVRSNVESPYGPVRAGLTISQTTNEQQLTELLSYLERKVDELIYKSCTALDTLNIATQAASVALSDTQIDEDGTDETSGPLL